jgi:hypothetical protein
LALLAILGQNTQKALGKPKMAQDGQVTTLGHLLEILAFRVSLKRSPTFYVESFQQFRAAEHSRLPR